MGRFIIDADTRRAWKSVGDTGCRASSVASEYLSAHGVEFPAGRAGSDGLHHGLAGFGDNTTSTKECIEIFLLVISSFRDSTPDRSAPSRVNGDSLLAGLAMAYGGKPLPDMEPDSHAACFNGGTDRGGDIPDNSSGRLATR